MSDSPFQRPGATTPPEPVSWPYQAPILDDPSAASAVDVTIRGDHEGDGAGTPTVGQTGVVRFRSVVAVGVVALLVGVTIGTLALHRPTPAATPITLDSFPQELLGLTREDFELRDGGPEVVVERLDAHFKAQLDGYRFAYGAEGAQFRYGKFTTLTIVNGQLAPDVPISDATEWATPTVVSLRTGDTSCVSWEANNSNGFVFINVETGLPLDPVLLDAPKREEGETVLWTDCVLFDRQRNLSLRLDGRGPSHDILEAAGQFRDELERLHATLIG